MSLNSNFLSGKREEWGKREIGQQAGIFNLRLGLVEIEVEIKRHRKT
jgi:hypothetical protein